jgi:signal transduction histidine kinase
VGIWINDNGLGIPADICDKIFDPFFTTKPVGKGTGLGLSTAYEVVQRHGGSLSVSSQMGEGTEFAIVLPQQQALTSQPSEAAVGSSIG